MSFNETMMYGQAMQNFQGALEHWMGVSTEAKLRKNNEELAAENEELRRRLFDIADERDSLTTALRETRRELADEKAERIHQSDDFQAFRAALREIIEKAPQIEAEGFQIDELRSSDPEADDPLPYIIAKNRVRIQMEDDRSKWVADKDAKRVQALRDGTAPVPECLRASYRIPEAKR